MPDDLLATIRQVLLEQQIDSTVTHKVEIRIRQQLGGSRIYVPKAPTLGKVQRLADAVAAGAPLRTAFDAAGVSRATGYRLLARRWRVR